MTAEQYVQITTVLLITAPKGNRTMQRRGVWEQVRRQTTFRFWDQAQSTQVGATMPIVGDINLECILHNNGGYCIWNICLHKLHTLKNVPEFYEMSPTIRKHRRELASGLQAKTPWLIIHSSGHPEHQF